MSATCSGMRGRSRDCEDSISTEIGLVWCAVHLDHEIVDLALLGWVEADKSWSDLLVDLLDSVQASLAEVTGATVTELTGLIIAGE